MKRTHEGGRRGQVLVIFAISAVALLGITGLAIDGARILVDQRSLQNSVDGAALTGALDIGPGAGSGQLSTALDDTVYAIEQTLSLDFSNNYSVGHHLTTNDCHGVGCYSSPAPGTTPAGPYNPSNAGSSPCCNSWVDRSGAYTLTVTTPYTYAGTVEPEAFIRVSLTHNLPLVIVPGFGPVPVTVKTIARNHAIPYAIFDFKHNEKADMSANGTTSLTTNKRVGVNGSVSMPTNSLTFNCTNPPTPSGYGGDLWEYVVQASGPIKSTSVTELGCPSTTPSLYKSLGGYVFPPNVHLPADPCLTAGVVCGPVQAPITVTGTMVLTPTRSSDPTQPFGPRYSSVSVGTGNTLILQPGVYFFEGTTTGSGLVVSSGGTAETGDCYLDVLPACWPPGSAGAPPVCTAPPFVLAIGGSGPYHCTSDFDFGVLLVFWPAGPATDPSSTCTNVNPTASTNYYCTRGPNDSGSYNQLSAQGSANLYLTSSPKYHSVSVFVDSAHPSPSTTWNFTASADLATAGCVSNSCALQIGLGSHVIYVQGGSSISINGAILAPADNTFLGGAGSGSGYGQILSYTTNFIGNAAIVEGYNPIALAYVPVIVQ